MKNFDRFCDLFFNFADPTLKKYFDTISSNRTLNVKGQGFCYDEYTPGFDESEVRSALLGTLMNSPEYLKFQDRIAREFNVKDKTFNLCERPFSLNITKEIKRILSVSMMALGTFTSHTKLKNDDVMINDLKRIFHLSTEINHKVKIIVKTHKLIMNRKILSIRGNNLIIDMNNDKPDSTTILLTVTGRDNSSQKDPLRTTSIFMGILSIIKKDLSYEILDIEYPCGCEDYLEYERNLYSFTDYASEKFFFTAEELEKITYFTSKLNSSDINNIHFAVEKFMSSNNRKSTYDKILDLVIAMEILLGKGESVDSIKYKICNRIMNCLSSDTKERQELYTKITNIYDTRSKIVHGSLQKRKAKKDFDSCVNNISYFREIIRLVFRIFIKYVNNKMNHQEIIRKLDFDVRDIFDTDLSNIKWLD